MKMKNTKPAVKMAAKAKKTPKKYPKLTKTGFVNWLKRQPANRKFKGQDEKFCPLATCLKDAGAEGVEVNYGHYIVLNKVRGLPEWADAYIAQFDEMTESTVGTGRERDKRRVKTHVALKAAKEVGLIK